MDKIKQYIRDGSGKWIFQCWEDRYNRGIWAILAPHINHVYELYEILDGGDMESTELGFYLAGDGAWLPTALCEDIETAIDHVNRILMNFEYDSKWQDDVYEAFQTIIELKDELEFKAALERREPSLIRTGVVQPEEGLYFLRKVGEDLKLITVSSKTLQVIDEKILDAIPVGWTQKDVTELLDEGRRFFGE